nr:hypothetical protein [Tanacetum cinerariifolium]
EQINKIDFIDAGGIDFESEEIEHFLNDDSIPFGVEDSPFNMEEDILFLESLLREDPIPPHLIISNQTKFPMEEPKHSFKMGKKESGGNMQITSTEWRFTISPRPHHLTNDNTNIESFSLLPIPIHESNSHQEEINVVSITNDVLPPRVENDDSDKKDSDFDNPPLPLPHPEPPDEEFEITFAKEISVVRSAIVKSKFIDARVKFDVFNDENDVLSYFRFVIFAKELSLLSTESKDTIFDPGISN